MPKPTIERSTTQAEEMRQQRNQEVRQLIGSRVNNAKAIFSQETAAGQLINKNTKTAPVKPVRNSISRTTNNNQQQQQSPESDKSQPQQSLSMIENQEVIDANAVIQSANNNLQEPTFDEHDLDDSYSTIKRSPHTKVANNEANDNNKPVDVKTDTHEQLDTDVKQVDHDVQPTDHTGNIVLTLFTCISNFISKFSLQYLILFALFKSRHNSSR